MSSKDKNSSKGNPENKEQQELDLGLKRLISAFNQDSTEAKSLVGDQGEQGSSSENLGNIEICQKLADENRWSELAETCEEKMSSSKANREELQLWWIRANLKLKSMPVSLLVAPLDGLVQRFLRFDSSEVDNLKHLKDQLSQVLTETYQALMEVGEEKLAFAVKGYLKQLGIRVVDEAEVKNLEAKEELVLETKVISFPVQKDHEEAEKTKINISQKNIALISVFGSLLTLIVVVMFFFSQSEKIKSDGL